MYYASGFRFQTFCIIFYFLTILLFFIPVAKSSLDITVKGYNDEPLKDVKIQVFPGKIHPDSDVNPIAPPNLRNDGLVGFVTDSSGKTEVNLSSGDYTVVAFHHYHPSNFLIVKRTTAPGNVVLSAKKDASKAKIRVLNKEGNPMDTANVYIRPCKKARGLIGLVSNDGVIDTRITPGNYHIVTVSSQHLHYLVLPEQRIRETDSEIVIDAQSMPTSQLEIELPMLTGIAIYEVLGTELTYEYVQTIEETIGYDAAYTNNYFLVIGPYAELTLSTGLNYNFNIAYLITISSAGVYAYEVRPSTLKVSQENAVYKISSTEDDNFELEIDTDQNIYHPGDTVSVGFTVKDQKRNRLNRFFDYSGARLVFPYCIVKNPDGTVVAENSNAVVQEDFFQFSFVLSDSAKAGKYKVETYLDLKIYGEVRDSKEFTVKFEDKIPPVISKIDFPSPAEAGITFTIDAEISDNVAIEQISLKLGEELEYLRENNRYSFQVPEELALPGDFNWILRAVDSSGNETQREGNLLIQDSLSPEIVSETVNTAEVGYELSVEAEITDNVKVESAKVIYGNQQVEMKKNSKFYIAKIPTSHIVLGKFRYQIEAKDSSGNISSSSQQTVNVVDTIPPKVFHIPVKEVTAGESLNITVLVSDNNEVSEVILFYRLPSENSFKKTNMRAVSDSYTATIPASSVSTLGVEYRIEALDLPDLNGNKRKTAIPDNADVFSVSTRRISSIEIVPSLSQNQPLELTVGTSKKFEVVALDANNERMAVNPIWNVTDGLGNIEQDGTFFANTEYTSQVGRIIATISQIRNDEPLSAETYVKLIPGQVEEIHLTLFPHSPIPSLPNYLITKLPNSSSIVISAGDERQFYASVYDVYGNLLEVPTSWEVIGNIGLIDNTGKFKANKVGKGKIRTSVNGKYSECQIEVIIGEISELTILPKFATVQAGKSQEFKVNGIDQYGNRTRLHPLFSVRDGIGSVDSDGKFVATKSGEGEVVASIAGLHVSVQVTVTPGELKDISVEPFIEYIPISTDERNYKEQFVAFGWDTANNSVSIEGLRWQADAAAGKINQNGLFVSTKDSGTPLANIVINGSIFARAKSNGRRIEEKSVVVIYRRPPVPPYKLAISIENQPPGLSQLTLAAGEKYELEVTGIDSKNQRTAVSPKWRLVGDVGMVYPNGILKGIKVGNGTLIASYGAMTAEVDIEVTPGTLREIVIEPEFLELELEESCQLAASGYDAFGNSVELDRVSYSSEGIVDVNANGEIVARKPGVGRVTASVGEVRRHAHIFVNPPQQVNKDKFAYDIPDSSLITLHAPRLIYPNPLSIPKGEKQKFIAYKYDSNGNLVEITNINWRVTESLGDISQQGVFSAESPGSGYVTATDESGYTASAYLEVYSIKSNEREIEQIFIVPNREITLQVGQNQKFYVLGLEKSGSVRPVLASWTITPQIGQINALGILKASEKGECIVRANYGSLTDVCNLKVEESSNKSPDGIQQEEIPELWCESRRLAEIKIVSVPDERVKVKAGESFRLDSIGIDVEGKKVAVNPSWSIESASANIGTIGTNGLFVANKVGNGEIIATVDDISDSVSVEVTESRPTFARLVPDSLVISSNQPREMKFLAYDSRGNLVNVSPSSIEWQVVGDIGLIESDGSFIPNLDSNDRSGEIIAIVHEYNLLSRCEVFLREESEVKRIEVNPSHVNLIRGSNFNFNIAVVEQSGEQFDFDAWKTVNSSDVDVDWKVFRDEQVLPNIINSEGEVLTNNSLPIGESLHVVAELKLRNENIFFAEATASIITGPLNEIKIENISGINRISFGEKIELEAFGYDAWNNPVEFNPIWQVNPKNIGRLNTRDTTCSFTAEKQGFGTISASKKGISQTVDIVVIPPPVGGLTIVPATGDENKGQTPDNPFEVSADLELHLLTKNDAGTVSVLNWKVEPADAGRIESDVFYPQKTGEAKITAEIIGDQTDFFVRIMPGEVSSVQISPSVASVLTRENQKFSVSFFDCCGNRINRSVDYQWMTTGGIGLIDSSGLFKPIHVMVGEVVHGTVDVIAENVHGSANVTVLAKIGALSSINLTAEPETVSANSESKITVYGADSDGNLITSIKQSIQFQEPEFGEIRPTSQSERWIYSVPQKLPAQSQRQINLSAFVDTENGRISNSINIKLVPGSLSELKIEPKTAEIQAGDSHEFTLEGFDEFGNAVNLEQVNWILSDELMGELIDQNPNSTTYSAEQSGTVELTAESSGIKTVATILINPKSPVRLSIEPEEVSLIAGRTQEFQIFGIDEYGNKNLTVSDDLEWQFEGVSGQFENVPSELGKFVFSSSTEGEGSVKISYEISPGKTISVSAEIKVSAGGLDRLELILLDQEIERSPPFELISGGDYKIRASGFDQYGNSVEAKLNWSLSGDIGKFSPQENEASIEALYIGEGEITVSSGTVSKSEQIKVVPATMTIGTDGGILKTPVNVSLEIPKGVLDKEVKVEIAVIHSPGSSEETERISRVYDIKPPGLILRKPAKLTVPVTDYDIDILNPQYTIRKLYFWDEFSEEWTSAGGSEEDESVSCYINNFASYAVMATDEPAKEDELSIRDLRITPPVFYAPENNRVTVEYRITNSARITIKIFDFRDRLVTTLLDSIYQQAGINSVRWDGVDDQNERVKNGRYIVVIIAESDEETASFSKLLVVFK